MKVTLSCTICVPGIEEGRDDAEDLYFNRRDELQVDDNRRGMEYHV